MRTLRTKNHRPIDLFNGKLQLSVIGQLVIILLFMLFTVSCSKEPDTIVTKDEEAKEEKKEEEIESNNDNGVFELIDVTINLPEDVAIDFSKTQINSLLETHDVSENGSSKASIPKDGKSFAYLSDPEGNIILMGFISKERPSLDIKSTLESSLYFSFGTVFQLSEIREKFLNEFLDVSEIEPFVKELEEMYKADALILKSEPFTLWLNNVAITLTTGKEIIDVNNSILVSDNTIKSGITIAEDNNDLFSVNVLNYWRRRAKAFFYKTHEKMEGQSTFVEILNPNLIGANDVTADAEINVDPVAGLTSIQGNALEIAIGNGGNLGFSQNGPIKLQLNNNLTAAKYEVRVFGPGSESLRSLTKDEAAALKKIKIEILMLDFVIPVISTAVGAADIKDFEKGFNIDGNIEIITGILSSTPNGIDALDEGDYKTATIEFVKALIANASGTELFWEKVIVDGLKKVGLNTLVDFKDIAAKLAAPLTIANGILTGGDLIRLAWTSSSSQELEIFKVTVGRGKVRINKSRASISDGQEIQLKTKVLDDENIEPNEYKYIWSTNGSYGDFNVNSETNEIAFKSNSELPLLPPKTKDSVFVAVYKGDDLVGRDSTAINIVNDKYKIKPNGTSMAGGDQLRLRIVDEDDKPIEISDSEGSFRIFWSTKGDYGSFEGSKRYTSGDAENSIVYQCFDRQAEKVSELVQARIYFYDEANGNEQILIQEIDANINIDNNPNDGFFVSFEREVGIRVTENDLICRGAPSYRVGQQRYTAIFPLVENAISYKKRILKKDGTYGPESTLNQSDIRSYKDLGDGTAKVTLHVGRIIVNSTCSLTAAEEDQEYRFKILEDIGHQGFEIIPVFN